MKRFIIGILLLAILTMSLTGCVSKETFENVQQDLLTAEAQIAELSSELDRAGEGLKVERGRSAELASSLEKTGAELEETQTTLTNTQRALTDAQTVTQDTKAQLSDLQEQLRAISETPFGLYYIMDTPSGQQLESLPDSETLIDGSILIRDSADMSSRFGYWMLVGASAPGVEIDRDVMSDLITGPGLYDKDKTVAIGYQEICEKWGGTWSADHYGSIVWVYIHCTWKSGLGWVSNYPIRVLKHPLVEYHVNAYGRVVPPRFEILEETKQVMTLALAPELIVQARESAAEAGVDFEEWLTEAILAKIE